MVQRYCFFLNPPKNRRNNWIIHKNQLSLHTGINRQSPTYDYEMQRIGKILNYLNPDFKNN